jgi:hypothetical protein
MTSIFYYLFYERAASGLVFELAAVAWAFLNHQGAKDTKIHKGYLLVDLFRISDFRFLIWFNVD